VAIDSHLPYALIVGGAAPDFRGRNRRRDERHDRSCARSDVTYFVDSPLATRVTEITGKHR
jgi:hypothetical protein